LNATQSTLRWNSPPTAKVPGFVKPPHERKAIGQQAPWLALCFPMDQIPIQIAV